MRALVISDTHFGAWTGDDILRQPETLALLEPHLDVDEVILLGDMFDFMFGSIRAAFSAAEGLFDLLREKLQGKRFVFLAGNHDHHIVRCEAEELLGLELATGKPANELRDELGHRVSSAKTTAKAAGSVGGRLSRPTASSCASAGASAGSTVPEHAGSP